jgi:energy-coupling factor transport system ATP-binding protein
VDFNRVVLVQKELIKFITVSFSYLDQISNKSEKPALENIDISVYESEFLVIMGDTGSGKSTICKLLNGIIPHFTGGDLSGTVIIDGESTIESNVPNLAVKIGMVLDDPEAQIFTSSVRDEVAFGPENLLLSVQEIEKRINQALSVVGLTGFEDRHPSTLSGGEKQRLVIASALAMKSKILVLDEPLCRLDPQGQTEVLSVLMDVKKDLGITIIMTSGSKIPKYAARVCIMANGRITACDITEKIITDFDLLNRYNIQVSVDEDFNSVFPINDFIFNSTQTPVIEIKDFSFSYGSNFIIKNLNLTVQCNDFIALTGCNGCGKTTLLKNITGLLRPASGNLFINGKNTRELSVSSISREIGFVMQNPDNQLFTGSVFKEVAFALKNEGLSKTEIQKRVKDALDIVALTDPDAFPHALNKADRTKAVISCVLAMGCKTLVFDEVDVGQDYNGSEKIMNIAKDLNSKGYTIIFVTHNMSLVSKYAHRLIMMNRYGIIDKRRNDQ